GELLGEAKWGSGALLKARNSFVNDPAGYSGRTPLGECGGPLNTRREDSTTGGGGLAGRLAAGVCFQSAWGYGERCDRGFRGVQSAVKVDGAFVVPFLSGTGTSRE